jgi:tripartite-type tricarboxylate transporter receptor subunit TctC
VPFAPGGSTDIFARLIAERAQAVMGQPMVVENRGGAAGNIGAEAVVRAAPDGYTLLMATTGVMAINNSLYKTMTYDAAKDLEPVLFVASITNVLIVPADSPAKNVGELIAAAKKAPGSLSFASSGAGSSTHMSAELFKALSGTDLLHVPYKGSGQAISDLVGGHIKVMISGMASTLPHVRSGKLNGIVTTGLKRTPATQDIPTISETYPGFESSSWFGVLAPAGTAKPIVTRLNADIHKALQDPAVAKRLAGVGFEITYGTPEEFTAYIKSEIKKWAKVVKASGAKPD